ncbi:GNAT family N-acetyltransferase [Sulfurimonas sp.]
MANRTKQNIEILSTTNPKWKEYFDSLENNLKDPYFTNAYYELENKNAECFVYKDDKNMFFYPYIKTHINSLGYELDKNYYDIQGAYGYNGALVQDDTDTDFINKARKKFLEYAKEENIIAEFVRFNPLYTNHKYFSDITPINANKNIIVDLKETDIWMNSYEYSTRKNVNKALRNNLTYKIIESKDMTKIDIENFSFIYNKTMTRNNADLEYLFNLEYFTNITNKLKQNAIFIFIYKDDVIISTELVLLNDYVAYSYLGGTLKEYFEFRPNDYLKHILIKELQERGLTYFMLGGGISINDGIFKYKKNFSKNGIYDFFISKSIYNYEVYDLILKQWCKKVDLQTQEKYNHYLLKYHYGVS